MERCFWELWWIHSYLSCKKELRIPQDLAVQLIRAHAQRRTLCVCVCLCLCAVPSETSNRKEEPCQDYLSWDRRNPCITHPEGCAPRSRRTSRSPDNENNEVRLSKETVSLPYPQTSAPGREEELSERSLWAVRVKDGAEQPLKPIRSKRRAHKEGESRMSSREINNNMKKNFNSAEEA